MENSSIVYQVFNYNTCSLYSSRLLSGVDCQDVE